MRGSVIGLLIASVPPRCLIEAPDAAHPSDWPHQNGPTNTLLSPSLRIQLDSSDFLSHLRHKGQFGSARLYVDILRLADVSSKSAFDLFRPFFARSARVKRAILLLF